MHGPLNVKFVHHCHHTLLTCTVIPCSFVYTTVRHFRILLVPARDTRSLLTRGFCKAKEIVTK
jgi:hypothetical protein